MMHGSDIEEFESFLASHAPIRQNTSLVEGECVGEWRITAFLGKGGSGEVYRAERIASRNGTSGTIGTDVVAIKVLVKEGNAARARFLREIDLLSKNWHAAFPCFYGSGMVGRSPRDRCDGKEGTLYYAMELLSPVDLPSTEPDIVDYILAVSRAVAILHRSGLVHRDIKPQNIMRRANGDLVLIDLGLVKKFSASASPSGTTVTLVDGKVAGVGTPLYAAPEQFNGGAISPATDIHALGMLANECFGGHPPRDWERIISRSTSSIPERRYGDIDAFAQAIRHRHYGRIATCCGVAAAIVFVTVMIVLGNVRRPATAAPSTSVQTPPQPTWHTLARDIRTNNVEGTVIRLNNKRHSFAAPMLLETNRVYWIVGPGTLDVSLNGGPGSNVCLDNCVLINRTTNSVAACGIRYVFRKGSYLNFINLDRNEQSGYNAYMKDFDGACNALEFGGPETLKALLKRRADKTRNLLEIEKR